MVLLLRRRLCRCLFRTEVGEQREWFGEAVEVWSSVAGSVCGCEGLRIRSSLLPLQKLAANVCGRFSFRKVPMSRRRRALVWLSAVLCVALCTPASAWACSYIVTTHELDPEEVGVDTEPPTVVVESVTIREGAARPGCSAVSTSCDDIGVVTINIDSVSDDRTPPEQIGYRVEFLGDFPADTAPFSSDQVYRAERDGLLTLLFVDPNPEEEGDWDFSVVVYAVDLAGNESEASEVFDLRQKAGCIAASGAFGPPSALVFVFAVLFGPRRFARRVAARSETSPR